MTLKKPTTNISVLSGGAVFTSSGSTPTTAVSTVENIEIKPPVSTLSTNITINGTATGSDDNNTSLNKLIRIATNFEIAEMAANKWPNYNTAQRLVAAEYYMKRFTSFGSPIHVFSSTNYKLYSFHTGNYITIWFHSWASRPFYTTFIGYDAGSAPTQTVTYKWAPAVTSVSFG